MASASSQETVRVAAQRMSTNDVGTLVVLDGGEVGPIGIITDRDMVLRCLAPGLDPDRTPISSIMTRPVHTVSEQAPIEEALRTMAQVGTRRLVVLGEIGRPVGVLSLDDLLDVLADEAGAIGRLLGKQQSGIAAAIGAR
jgi:CBS domain-containing protein